MMLSNKASIRLIIVCVSAIFLMGFSRTTKAHACSICDTTHHCDGGSPGYATCFYYKGQCHTTGSC
jgi:hypothetical protein